MRVGGIRMSSKEWLACARALIFVSIGCAAFAPHAEDRGAPINYSARVINPKLTGSLY
jgi:hypothetical protein